MWVVLPLTVPNFIPIIPEMFLKMAEKGKRLDEEIGNGAHERASSSALHYQHAQVPLSL